MGPELDVFHRRIMPEQIPKHKGMSRAVFFAKRYLSGPGKPLEWGSKMVRKIWTVAAAVIMTVSSQLGAQVPVPETLKHTAIAELVDFLKLPNVAADRAAIRVNATTLMAMLQRRNLAPKLLLASDTIAPPAVYGEWLTPGAKHTVVFYAHYDGQPTDANKWTVTKPWSPIFLSNAAEKGGKPIAAPVAGDRIDPDWRIYGRSSSDDKAGVVGILSAIDALRAAGKSPSVNIKLFFEGEEEAGSPHLADILARNKSLLQSDAWIICDGPVHQSGRKQVVFGARGDVNVNLTVFGPTRPLHSGHYGNWAPNPAMTLVRLLASMKDESGRVLIRDWYSDVTPLTAADKAALRKVPAVEPELMRELGIPHPDGNGKSLVELISEPSLNINGIAAADVGAGARNVIPTFATATLDLRLVKGNDYKRQIARLVRHIRSQGFYVLDRDPTMDERRKYAKIARVNQRGGGDNAERVPLDDPFAKKVAEAVQSTSPEQIVLLPTSGGSLPVSTLREILGAKAIVVPIVNYDNNQHAEDENLRIGNLFEGIQTLAAVMLVNW